MPPKKKLPASEKSRKPRKAQRSLSDPETLASFTQNLQEGIYITNEDGVTIVMRAGPKFEVLAENAMDEYCLSTIAISEGQLFLRTDKALYAIGQRKPAK